MTKLLEVIVTSAAEAREAEAGGADRLELVRDLECGGLTPRMETVREVVEAVSIPVRVMLRENAGMSAGTREDRARLGLLAGKLAECKVNGLVAGFVQGNTIDTDAMSALAAAAPSMSITFHRAFESVADPPAALQMLRSYPQVDRILIRATAQTPLSRLREWQAMTAPAIRIITGIGLASELLGEIAHDPVLSEVHVGRWVREPQISSGRLDRSRVARLKSVLS